MRIWSSALALAALSTIVGCGDEATLSLVVGANHVVRDGRTGDVAVAWEGQTGIAAWVAIGEGTFQFIRIEPDGSPVATVQTLQNARVTENAKVRAFSTSEQFFLLSIDPTAGSHLAVVSQDGFASPGSDLPAARSVAVAPPILAMVEPMAGTLLLGEIGTDSPRLPAPSMSSGLLAVGAAFKGGHGVVVVASGQGCVSGVGVDHAANPVGTSTPARCFPGAWQDASVIVWPVRSGVFAAAVGFTGSSIEGELGTSGFSFEFQVSATGHASLTRATSSPVEPQGSGFFGVGETALQVVSGDGGAEASLFDAFGHALSDGPVVVWSGASAGTAHAVTSTGDGTWVALDAVNRGQKSASFLYARAIDAH